MQRYNIITFYVYLNTSYVWEVVKILKMSLIFEQREMLLIKSLVVNFFCDAAVHASDDDGGDLLYRACAYVAETYRRQ